MNFLLLFALWLILAVPAVGLSFIVRSPLARMTESTFIQVKSTLHRARHPRGRSWRTSTVGPRAHRQRDCVGAGRGRWLHLPQLVRRFERLGEVTDDNHVH